MVAVGSALFVTLGFSLGQGVDPTRIASYVVSGIGFLGAGVIMREGVHVKGINTAATLWCAAAVGVLSGAGFLFQACTGAGVVILVHLVLRPVSRAFTRSPILQEEAETTYRILVQCRPQDEQHIRALMLQAVSGDTLGLRSLSSEDAERPDRMEVLAEVVASRRANRSMEEVATRLSLDPGVSAVSWEMASVDMDEA